MTATSFIDRDAARVWNYWFSHRDLSGVADAVADPFAERYVLAQQLWFRGGADIDAEIGHHFGALVERAARGELDGWRVEPRSCLALVLLLDQFPRHIHRGTARAFAHDAAALALADDALARGLDRELAPAESLFLFLALSHSERLADVQRALAGITELATRCTRGQQRTARAWRIGTQKHIDVLERFGRYPHRNAALGRDSTPEEAAFLARPEFTALFMRSQQPRADAPAAAPPAERPQPTRPVGPRLKILALHGFRQNGDVFRARTRKLRQALDDIAELVYVTSPLVYSPQGDTREATLAAFGEVPEYRDQRVWWQSSADNRVYEGIDAAVAALEQVVRSHGPFDGVVGFAQGGTLAALLAAMQPHPVFAFRFAICISAFPSRADAHAELVRPHAIAVPSLHVLGLNDILVTPDRSIALFEAFDPAHSSLVKHPGGHFVPGAWPYPEIHAFARRFLDPGAAAPALESQAPSLIGLAWEALGAAARGDVIDLPLALGIVQQMADHGHWRDLQALAVHAFGLRGSTEDPALLAVHDEIVERFAARLRLDLAAALAVERGKPVASPRALQLAPLLASAAATAATDPDEPAWPSACAREAPRIGGHADKVARLARDIAGELYPSEVMRAFIAAREQQPRDQPRSPAPPHVRRRARQDLDLDACARRLAYQRYSQACSLIGGVLAEQDPRHPARQPLIPREQSLEQLRARPISRAVVEPEPEPVVPCALADLDPLLGHLRHNLEVARQTAFSRGTLTVDGRLDLCKQVVGPDGIRPLLGAMCHSDRVRRLLLGNNIIGDGGAAAIAEFLRARSDSPLDCWYIAGNHIGPAGIAHVCDALADDTRVTSLWLKRNPLKPAGMRPIAGLLRRNRTLEVLDLVNCGLLDDGLQHLLGALMGPGANKTLRHLYLGTNGVTEASAPLLAEFLADHCALESLYLSCNRLGDDGVAELARGLAANRTIRRVSLASNRIGPRGAAALADALAEHPSLVLLDLGFTKATAAVGELGNFIGDPGAQSLAELLRRDTRLRSLDLLHNYISQRGVNHIREAMKHNHTLVSLQLTQFGKVHNEPGKEELRAALQRNRARVPADEVAALEQIDLPDHIRDIYSVYRTHM